MRDPNTESRLGRGTGDHHAILAFVGGITL